MHPRQALTKAIWHAFVSQPSVEASLPDIDPHLQQVWARCRRQQRHDHWPRPHRAKGVTFDSILKSKAALMNVAVPAIEDIYEYLENDSCALLICDETGCTLYSCATADMQHKLHNLGILEGSYWREGIIGNNAVSSARHLAKATQTIGYEHFKQALHDFAVYAAPVFDGNGSAQGCIALVLPAEKASVSALGLIHSAARDIASQVRADNMLTESNQHLSEVHVLLEGVAEGVLAWYPNGKIHYLNRKGRELLGLGAGESGRDISTVMTLPQSIQQAIRRGKGVDMVETTIECKGKLIPLVVSLKIVKNDQNETHSYIALLYPLKHIRDLIHHHAGNRARLTFDDIVGVSDAMQRTIRQARHAARGRGPVLLHGEDGLGKSHLAQAIHNASDRQDQPFIAINCQAIPKELMATEFLGAILEGDSAAASKFELAHGGTLFLDQVECLSAEVQAALLHLLKTGLLNRMNGNIVSVDVRIIASSTIDLAQAVTEKHFRGQLLLELQTFDIPVPPLRERREDVAALVERNLMLLTAEKKHPLHASQEAMSYLENYRWPGNHRELRNVIERAANFAQGTLIQAGDLPDSILLTATEDPDKGQPQSSNNLADAERNTIIRSAILCRGTISKMCDDLQISRTTLWRKLKHYGLEMSDYK
ncbi:PTS-dependent dihydroxyacetone kinase operon transcriptional regulator DhaR [Photobacterium proteolyticum]|uniref:PTS-dependent dihydroxyacetone kinase operon transcriptional regulator DhaR n=1 Tax=Photobacterium proteolyticum TaxID=1903952 RepID=A0A1Q9GFL3_9GAMM|nr:dihydroxyacetone kinase operon transcriptional regulator DhaR [Photobacterium proteolyticum]OLQ73213.1 PTS-dependent dihydroxyacetone kinase operon transcriptional regulator DhaR [Photobacterium proteolyticum]